jgi:hypothetical protein
VLAVLVAAVSWSPAGAAEPEGATHYRKDIEPLLDQFCFRCHGGGSKKGGVAFDQAEPAALLENHDLWWKTLKMLRAGMMPPQGRPRPTAEQVEQIESWIKRSGATRGCRCGCEALSGVTSPAVLPAVSYRGVRHW